MKKKISRAGKSEAVAEKEEVVNETKKKPRKKASQLEVDPEAYAPRAQSAWKIGAHVSAAGGVENAVLNAASIGYLVVLYFMSYRLLNVTS